MSEPTPSIPVAEKDVVKPEKPENIDSIRVAEEDGFKGSLPVDLDRVLEDTSTPLREKLSADIGSWLDAEIRNQEPRIANISKWNKQYSGIRSPKAFPYAGANNESMPLTMYHTDATTVRLMDAVWGQKKLFIVRGQKEPFIDLAPHLEDGLDWWQKNVAHLKKKAFSPILQCVKTGTGFVKMDYKREKRVVYRYAKPAEVSSKAPGLFKYNNGQWGIKEVKTVYDGPDLYPISREDFVYSSDATSIQSAFLVGFRKYLRKAELKVRVKQGLYDSGAVAKMQNADETDATKKARAESEGREIRDAEVPDKFEVWELWLRYDVDGDGVEDDIVVTFHKASKSILRATYNPFFMGFRPFVALVFNPNEYSIEGRGVCEILENLQETIDFLVNARLDRLEQINAPLTVIQEGCGLDDFKRHPGATVYVQGPVKDVIQELKGSDIYPSSFTEESVLNQYAEKLLASAANLGASVSERPVARETIALLQETNKKFKFGIDNIRDGLGEVGLMAIEMFAQYQPTYEYYVDGAAGGDGKPKMEQKTIDFPLEYLRDGINVELMASSELLNTEVRQQIGLTAYQLLSDYYTKTAGMIQAMVTPGTDPALVQYLLVVLKVGGVLLRRVLGDLGIRDAETMMPELEKDPALQAAIQRSGMLTTMAQEAQIQQMAAGMAQGGGQGGGPGGPPPGPGQEQAPGMGGGEGPPSMGQEQTMAPPPPGLQG